MRRPGQIGPRRVLLRPCRRGPATCGAVVPAGRCSRRHSTLTTAPGFCYPRAVMGTTLRVRVVCCDAKVIGSLVGGCRITVRDVGSGAILARGEHLGGSGDTVAIMKTPRQRGGVVFDTPGTAHFDARLNIAEPTLVEVRAEGPLAFPHALHSTTRTTWVIPGEDVRGEGLVMELSGFIIDILQPRGVDVLHSGDPVRVEAGVRLL